MGTKAKPSGKNAKPAAAAPTLRWDDLELLLALGRGGSLSTAAARLAVNVSTVARRLDAMEARLAVHLFDRTPTGVAATEMAEALFPVAEAMERAAADAMRVVAGRETEPEGAVRLTAPPGLASWFIAPALARLRGRHPRLRVELDASVGYADLTRRQADLALRAARPTGGDLVAVRLLESGWTVVAAPSLARRVGRLTDVDAVDWISWGEDLAHMPDARWLAAHVAADRVALRTSSMDAQLHAARAGLGAMLVPTLFLRLVDLTPLPLGRELTARLAPLPTGALWLVGHRALRDVPRVRAVWDWVIASARRLGL